MASRRVRRRGRGPRILAAVLAVAVLGGAVAVWTDTLGAGERFDHLVDRIELAIDPPPNRPTRKTVVIAASPSARPTRSPTEQPSSAPSGSVEPSATPTPVPTPTPLPVREPVDVSIVDEPEKVFASEITTEWCAPAGTQMVLAILGLGDTSEKFQRQLVDRTGEWDSWEDSHNGGWGPGAIALALAAYGALDYEIRAYDSRAEALRGSAIALSNTGKPVVFLTWRGAHTWVMTGYRADADPTIFSDAKVSGTYILDPWYPRVSTIWGRSDGPGVFQDAAEMERNFLGWKRPEGHYPDRDGRFLVIVPTEPLPDR
jgi:hypothetical protein